MRKGFSLIELIVTIVVISTSFIVIPSIIMNSVRSAQWLSTSTGVYHGLAQIEIVRSKLWDQNNAPSFNQMGYYNVLDLQTNRGIERNKFRCSNDVNSSRFGMRPGHFVGHNRRQCFVAGGALNTQPTPFANFGTANPSIAIEHYDSTNFTVANTYRAFINVGYSNYNLTNDNNATDTQGTMSNFRDANQTSNIKHIRVNVRMVNGGINVSTYDYYATNIGVERPIIKNNP